MQSVLPENMKIVIFPIIVIYVSKIILHNYMVYKLHNVLTLDHPTIIVLCFQCKSVSNKHASIKCLQKNKRRDTVLVFKKL